MATHQIALQEHSIPGLAPVTVVATCATDALLGGVAAKVTRFACFAVTSAVRSCLAGVSLVA